MKSPHRISIYIIRLNIGAETQTNKNINHKNVTRSVTRKKQRKKERKNEKRLKILLRHWNLEQQPHYCHQSPTLLSFTSPQSSNSLNVM